MFQLQLERICMTFKLKSTLLLAVAALSGLTLAGCTDETHINPSGAPVNSVEQSKENPATEKSPEKTPETRTVMITKDLISYTTAQSPGPTKNYYYENGHAAAIKDLPAGSYSFQADSKGRSGVAVAKLTYNQFEESKGSRQGTPLDPPYWPRNLKVAITYSFNDRTYHGYMWNRSHSIADSLLGAASYDSVYNFTAGTRPQNVGADQKGGMRYAESMVENYWRAHPNTNQTVSYQTTPIYHEDERIPRGSIVDIKSSDGQLNREIVVINSAEGLDIDYN